MSEKSYGEMMDDVFQTIREQADRIEALEAALRKADTACFNLCVNHGFATGHGDTVAAMIEEIDAQISISDRRSVIELIHRIEALEAALRLAEDVLSRAPYSTGIWPNGMHPQRGITIIRAALGKDAKK